MTDMSIYYLLVWHPDKQIVSLEYGLNHIEELVFVLIEEWDVDVRVIVEIVLYRDEIIERSGVV
jgi:hypothetical protein